MINDPKPQNDRERALAGVAAELAYLLQVTSGRCADLRGELAVTQARVAALETELAALKSAAISHKES